MGIFYFQKVQLEEIILDKGYTSVDCVILFAVVS